MVHSLQSGFWYLVFGIQFEYDEDSNFLRILSLLDKLFKKKLRMLVRTNIFSDILSASKFLTFLQVGLNDTGDWKHQFSHFWVHLREQYYKTIKT